MCGALLLVDVVDILWTTLKSLLFYFVTVPLNKHTMLEYGMGTYTKNAALMITLWLLFTAGPVKMMIIRILIRVNILDLY